MEHLDHLREVLMYEPRGITVCMVVSLRRPQVPTLILVCYLCIMKAGVRCGHGIIAVITVGIETGMFETKQKFIIDSPAEVIAYAKYNGSEVESVSFENVPSFVYKKTFLLK